METDRLRSLQAYFPGATLAGLGQQPQALSPQAPPAIEPPVQEAQGSPYQIRPNQDGTVSVINVQTGQIHFVGTPSAASSAQATLNYRNR